MLILQTRYKRVRKQSLAVMIKIISLAAKQKVLSVRNNIPEMFEAGDHVGLEVIPSEAELLLVIHPAGWL